VCTYIVDLYSVVIRIYCTKLLAINMQFCIELDCDSGLCLNYTHRVLTFGVWFWSTFALVFNGIYYAGREEWEYGYKRKKRIFLKFRIICLSLVLPNFSGISYILAFPIALWLELSFPTVRWGSISFSFIFWALVFNLYSLLHLNYGY
jgi:hypothetical protein